MVKSGRGAAWLARLLGVQEVPGSNPGGPTSRKQKLRTQYRNPLWECQTFERAEKYPKDRGA